MNAADPACQVGATSPQGWLSVAQVHFVILFVTYFIVPGGHELS